MRLSKLMMPAATLAGALALAGCGGGSDTPAADPPECEEGQTGTYPDCVDADDSGNGQQEPPTPLERVRALNEAVAELNTMAGDAEDKDSALMKATEADAKAASVIETGGVSAAARMAAAEAAGYLAKLQAARDAVAAARTAAGNNPSESELEAAEDALEDADERLKATVEESLTAISKMYDTDAKLDKRASDTAILVRGLFYDGTTFTDGEDEVRVVTAPIGEWDEDAFGRGTTRDGTMMTFAQIFADDLVDVRFALQNGALPKGIPVEGEEAPTVAGIQTGIAISSDNNTRSVAGAFQGILGMYVYAGDAETRPSVAAEAKFGEDWYFHPDSADAYYTEERDAEGVLAYQQATFFEWGLWLDDSDATEAVAPRLNVYAGPGVGSAGFTPDQEGLGDAVPDSAASSATYEGSAAGLSARRTGGKNDAPTYASGHFTADVELTATFGGTPALEGTIDGFRGGSHVDGDWKLEFSDDSIASGVAEGTAYEGDNAPIGSWNAAFYGGVDGDSAADNAGGKRPTGMYGDFVAGFGTGADVGDGTAAGVFHAD